MAYSPSRSPSTKSSSRRFTSGAEQTLPIWIFTNLARPQQLPVINVVAVFVILLSVIPVWIAQRLTREPVGVGAPAAAAAGAKQ